MFGMRSRWLAHARSRQDLRRGSDQADAGIVRNIGRIRRLDILARSIHGDGAVRGFRIMTEPFDKVDECAFLLFHAVEQDGAERFGITVDLPGFETPGVNTSARTDICSTAERAEIGRSCRCRP